MLCDSHTHSWICTISYHWFNISSVKSNFFIKHSVIITLQCLPVFHCCLPFFACRSIFTTFDIFKSHFIRSNHTTTCTHFNRKITKSKTSFHCQVANSRTRIFNKITSCTTGRHLRHHIKCYIFCCYSFS